MASDTDAQGQADPLADSLLGALGQSGKHAWRALNGTLDVASLEARLAALSLSGMLSWAVMIALTAFTAWSLLVAALVILLLSLGVTLQWALPAAALANLALMLFAMYRLRRLSEAFRFRATRALVEDAARRPPENEE